MAKKDPVKIVKLTSENVLRLKAVEITPEGNLVVIGGKNRQGKTSTLDSIEMLFGGKKTIPPKPVHGEEEKGRIIAELDNGLTIKRTFTAAGGTAIIVENQDGARFQSPQSILDELYGNLSFDPLDFMRMKAKEQLETLKNLVGLDFTTLDEERARVYMERTGMNRTVSDLEHKVSQYPDFEGVPDEQVDINAIINESREAQAHNQRGVDLENALQSDRENLEEVRMKIAELENTADQITERINKGKEELDAFKPMEVPDVQDKVNEAQRTNELIRQRTECEEITAVLEEAKEKAEGMTDRINDIDASKQKQLAGAKFPVEGLSFDENGVLFNGVPFQQASGAEALEVSLAMGMAMNPRLKVMLIRDGSLLDEDALKEVARMADANDCQVWMERVGKGEECSVIIEDGQVEA